MNCTSPTFAVVVTYHAEAVLAGNLEALSPQVDQMIVVDNGSAAHEVQVLRALAARLGFTLLENAVNLGIAAALNRGVRLATERGAAWVLLFDQDSQVTPGYVAAMLACATAPSRSSRPLGILVPRYVDSRSGAVLKPPPGSESDGLEAATTSGSLTPVEVFARCGLFAEELFIDGVDYEYSLRIRRAGHRIAECAEAMLLHSPGTPAFHTLLGKRFQAANYSPVRRYYQERNKIWVTRRYSRDYLTFCLGQFAISLKDLLKIVLVEQDKAVKCRFFFRGILDGLRERMGPIRQD